MRCVYFVSCVRHLFCDNIYYILDILVLIMMYIFNNSFFFLDMFLCFFFFFFFSSRRRHTRFDCDWSSDVCSSDLGDGRIVITAAKKYGARGVGIDINPQRIAEANANLKKEKLGDKVKFIQGDLFNANFAEATVVTLYLLPDINLELRPQLWRQLPVGARVVSHDYHMGDDWPPERTERPGGKVVYLWTIKPEHKAKAGAAAK